VLTHAADAHCVVDLSDRKHILDSLPRRHQGWFLYPPHEKHAESDGEQGPRRMLAALIEAFKSHRLSSKPLASQASFRLGTSQTIQKGLALGDSRRALTHFNSHIILSCGDPDVPHIAWTNSTTQGRWRDSQQAAKLSLPKLRTIPDKNTHTFICLPCRRHPHPS